MVRWLRRTLLAVLGCPSQPEVAELRSRLDRLSKLLGSVEEHVGLLDSRVSEFDVGPVEEHYGC